MAQRRGERIRQSVELTDPDVDGADPDELDRWILWDDGDMAPELDDQDFRGDSGQDEQ